MDKEAYAEWDLTSFDLVEKAGLLCAAALKTELLQNSKYSPCLCGPILVCAGTGNNGADALVLLGELVKTRAGKNPNAAVLLSRYPTAEENSPRARALRNLQEMGVPVVSWNGKEHAAGLFDNAALIIDGIAGTGIKGELGGPPLEMVNELNARGGRCCVVSIDVPSGAYSGWTGGQPVVRADITLAIEHLKTELYKPLLRLHCGKIIPVQGVFPAGLLEKHGDAWLLSWESCSCAIAPLDFGAYKYTRGLCEIHAGSTGTAGAALLAAAGASAAGAGLIKAVLDDDLYPVLGAQFSGVMAAPCSAHQSGGNNFIPHSMLLGPGWGKGDGRLPALQQALMAEESGAPVILDADGIYLIKKLFPDLLSPGRKSPVFHGRVILTPHAGELESLSGIPKTELLSNPQLIAGIAKTLNAVILFKSHVMVVSAPDGRLGFIDGMNPALGAGGSGDFLAGLCAGIAARAYAAEKAGEGRFDPFLAAAAAGALLVAAAGAMGRRFFDPGELALPAARLAGQAWLP